MLLWPGRWPVVWSRRCRSLRSSVALAGKVAGCLELRMVPPQNLCDSLARPRNSWHSVFHTVTRAACPPRSPGAKKAPAGACATNLSGQADPRALTRKVAGCLELKMAPPRSSATLSPVPETAGTLYSTRSPVQPALRGVPEPRRLPPAPVEYRVPAVSGTGERVAEILGRRHLQLQTTSHLPGKSHRASEAAPTSAPDGRPPSGQEPQSF